MRSTSRWIVLLALLALATAMPLDVVAQQDAIGAGEAPDVQVPPGLETRTPADSPIAAEDVPVYVPHTDRIIGRVSIPDQKLATLVQPEGRSWRGFRMQTLMWGSAIVILGTAAALAAFYLWRGPIRLEAPRSGRWVARFDGIERFAHWTGAVSFLVLAVTGLVITFGRHLLIPMLGAQTFAELAGGAKYVHNVSSVPFVVGVALMFVLWIRSNIPTKADVQWVKHAGGMLGRNHSFQPETGRFNAGQKGVFWIVVLGGAVMAATGYLLLTPFSWTGVSGMQVTHIVHGVLAAVMIAAILGHIYIGTIGMEGAFDAMGRGEVDETWAREHHSGWYGRSAVDAPTETDGRRSG